MKVNSGMLLCKFPLSVWVMTTLSGYKVTAVNMSTYRRQRGEEGGSCCRQSGRRRHLCHIEPGRN